jgi:hypothetical protein
MPRVLSLAGALMWALALAILTVCVFASWQLAPDDYIARAYLRIAGVLGALLVLALSAIPFGLARLLDHVSAPHR